MNARANSIVAAVFGLLLAYCAHPMPALAGTPGQAHGSGNNCRAGYPCSVKSVTTTGTGTTLTVSGDADVRGALSNGGAANGGAVAVNDAAGVRSIYTAGPLLIKSDTAATAGTDTAVTIQATALNAAPDNILLVKDSAGTNALQLRADLVAFFGSTVQAPSFLSTGDFRGTSGAPVLLTGNMTDGATAVAGAVNSAGSYATAGAKLFSYRNNGTEKASIDKDGGLSTSGARYVSVREDATAGAAITASDHVVRLTRAGVADAFLPACTAAAHKGRTLWIQSATGGTTFYADSTETFGTTGSTSYAAPATGRLYLFVCNGAGVWMIQ